VADLRAALDAYFAGVNEERYDDVAALFAPDATVTAPGAGTIRRPEIAAYLARALAAYPRHHDEPTRIILADRTATIEISFTGELADGRAIAFDALDVFDFDAQGRIARLTTWFDSYGLRKQLRA
jgi:ketosteroid isomerase-like protein